MITSTKNLGITNHIYFQQSKSRREKEKKPHQNKILVMKRVLWIKCKDYTVYTTYKTKYKIQ